MKYYHIEGEMSDEQAQKFIAFVNENDDNIVVYLDSSGGTCASALMIQDIISREPERFEVVASFQILSSAFELFFSVDCKKKIMPDTFGAYHLIGQTSRINAAGVASEPLSEFTMRQIRKTGVRQAVEFGQRIGMNPKEVDAIRRGKDVFFTNERLNQLLANEHHPAANCPH